MPTPAVQQHLLAVLPDNARATCAATPPLQHGQLRLGRSATSNPNQWAIETLAAAMEPATIRTRDQAQAWLRFKGDVPTTLHIRAVARAWARAWGRPTLRLTTTRRDKRFANQIETVTADSVLDWLQRTQWTAAPVVLPEK